MTLREILINDTTTRYKKNLKGLGVTNGESGDVAMMLKIAMKVAQDYSVFNYVPTRTHNKIKSQDITIVVETGANLERKFVLPMNNK